MAVGLALPKDAGQGAAVNEGWTRAGGEVLAWINSDDWYHRGAFAAMAPLFREPRSAAWVSGAVDDCASDGTHLCRHPARPTSLAAAIGFHQTGYYQPGMFWSRRLLDNVGQLDESTHLCFDLDFWARCLIAGFALTPVDAPIACFRKHTESKTSSRLEEIVAESREIFRRYAPHLNSSERCRAATWLREYIADLEMHIIFRCLREGLRGKALGILVRELRTVLALQPRKVALSVVYVY